MSREAEAERGRLAEAILLNPVYVESYELVEQALITKWKASNDPKEREDLHSLLRLQEKSRKLLEATFRDGRVAEKELERKQSLLERMARR